ncbi:kunitz-type protease inhibitor 2-like [Clinocottus analis]|uniref:kunitz-type protease inhibitor 2-like n=1 Tax=Clinocottus analis TaxID=304258 RepID=UPI0035BEFE11
MDRWSLLVLVLLGAGLALGCDWDQSVDPDQGLAVVDAAMGLSLDRISEVPDSESCRAKCCARSDCDLVLLRDPQDGPLQCLLVSCLHGDRDVCVLGPATRTRVYRRKGPREAGAKPQDAGDKKHVVPLMSSWQPLSNLTENRSQDVEPVATASTSAQEKEMSAADFAEHCGAEPQVGPCRAAFEHWYYNSKTGNCQTFIYGGCRGNKNNYVSKESCVATCTVRVLSSVKEDFTDEVSTEYKDGCMVTSDPGPCRAAFPMFYYDSNSATCQSFLYGGCRGNQNRYSTKAECLSRCRRDGSFEHRGKVREHWTAAVFLFVTLAAISALLLVTLVVITLRRHSRSRRLSSISDKEELLQEPDERSSLESLAVPESPKPDKA